MDEYSSNFTKGALIFLGSYLFVKAGKGLSSEDYLELYPKNSCPAVSSTYSYSKLGTVAIGMLGTGILFSVLFSKD